MKLKSIGCIAVLVMLIHYISFAALPNYSGKVTDANTKDALIGATVTIPDLRISVSTDVNGEFTFKNVPVKGKFLVQVSYVGYKTLTAQVDVAGIGPADFALQPTTIEAHEVVVTGSGFSSDTRRTSASVSVVSKADLITRPSSNLIDAVAKVPGVSQITTGNGISKPVIRGLSYNRVVTMAGGVKQEGQQWGDEHGIEIDQFGAEKVEVLRGASSLLYGSDALGGVINVIDPLPAPEGTLKGEFITNYSTNNGQSASSLMLSGNNNGFVYRARGTYKNAYSFKTPDGYFPNSGLNETDLSGQIGLNKSWGFAHLDVSSFRTKLGFYEPATNASGEFVDDNGDTFSDSQLKDRSLAYPMQDIRHYKAVLSSNLLLGSGSLKSTIGYQHNQRRELSEPAADPELFLDLNTYSYDVKYYFKEKNGWEPLLGTSGQFQRSDNTRGEEALIPSYQADSFGALFYIKKSWTTNTFNTGIRVDTRKITGRGLNDGATPVFTSFDNSFTNLSGALGFTHEFSEKVGFKVNAGTAFRAPNIAELSSNGVHEGAFRYEIGNQDLKPERSYQLDASLSYDTEPLNLSFGGFVNYVNDFIFYRNTNGETIVSGGDVYPVFRFLQDNAFFRGLEASLTLHPSKSIHFENTFGYTVATNKTTGNPVPFIPAASLRNELRFEPASASKKFTKTYLSVGLDNYFKQTRVDDFETTTSGYSLVSAGLGTTVKLGKNPLTLYASARNLLDKKYYDHLSRFKPGRLDETDPSFGIYNPGRNVTMGVYLSF
ncbi:TonB-dependent receptor [Hufsiella ginkgonis]|uniref:TonB-dependent receptor n=1 Tax=Hufsiella ginkgonis TaxID=2695274 RepID=A0A7K1XUL0_9SPHI|nr:TonB-dependent receptor [Hufsiella ginkgonis]MXV14488.1 TonB-dependent receptor [Hufsiella ginkgonis]